MSTPVRLEKRTIDRADALAAQVLEHHKNVLSAQAQPNYFLDPIRYNKTDTWLSWDWWIETAVKMVETWVNSVAGLEILLHAGHNSFLPTAIELVESCWNEELGISDAEYLYDLIAHFPRNHPIFRWMIASIPVDGVDADPALRRALIVANHQPTCELFSKKLCDLVRMHAFSDLDREIMPWLVELGLFAKGFVDHACALKVKAVCLGWLESDHENFLRPSAYSGQDPDDRELWAIDQIAWWAWAMGWEDVLRFLADSDWYWSALGPELLADQDRVNLLIWSHRIANSRLIELSIDLMESHVLEGAIAWSRLRRHLI